MEVGEWHPMIGCEEPWHYRNKMEFSFSQNMAGERYLGLMLSGSRGKVATLSECHIYDNRGIGVYLEQSILYH